MNRNQSFRTVFPMLPYVTVTRQRIERQRERAERVRCTYLPDRGPRLEVEDAQPGVVRVRHRRRHLMFRVTGVTLRAREGKGSASSWVIVTYTHSIPQLAWPALRYACPIWGLAKAARTRAPSSSSSLASSSAASSIISAAVGSVVRPRRPPSRAQELLPCRVSWTN